MNALYLWMIYLNDKAEQELSGASEAGHYYHERVPLPFFIKYLKGAYLSVNSLFQDRFGLSSNDLNEHTFEALICAPKRSEDRLEETLARIWKPQVFSYSIIDPAKKEPRIIHLTVYPDVFQDKPIRTTYITALIRPGNRPAPMQ